jgi:hypothetical protein
MIVVSGSKAGTLDEADVMATSIINAKKGRRWVQFSLRTLLVFMLLVTIGCGWFARKLYKARQQRQAVATIIGMGGGVRYDFEQDPVKVKRKAGWLVNLLGQDFFQDVVSASVGANVTQEVLTRLDWLHHLNQLGFRDSSIYDGDLSHLHQWPELQYLYLSGTEITDAGLKYVERCSNLICLDVSETKITDVGLKSIQRLARLERLRLGATKITDSGLDCLKTLSQLRNLDVGATQVTDAGLETLRSALPGLEINVR